MYKNPVQPATIFLDGLRTRKLQPVCGMDIPARLKAIRESLPTAAGVRQIAAVMGSPDTPNAYGYYESRSFTRSTLPLDKARAIAKAFERFGGNPADVLELAGLAPAETAAEAVSIQAEPAPAFAILLPVALPNEDRLTTMMESVLDAADLGHLSDGYAARLAQLLPDALAQAAAPLAGQPIGRARPRASAAQPPAKAGPDTKS